MADAICRWRNPYLATVIELIGILPKEELSQNQARDIVNEKSPYDFYRTPYQLACQLGLYYETEGKYFPKFKSTPSEQEVVDYLVSWIIHYTVPNPYTRGFENLQSFSIHSKICAKLLQEKNSLNFEDTLRDIFHEEIGNVDILANSIDAYSPVLSIENRVISLKDNKVYGDLVQYINVDTLNDRNDKEYFFDLFPLPNKSQIEYIETKLDSQDIILINQIQTLPNLTQTEKEQIISARIGQGYFRRNLILECSYCPLTSIDDPKLLIASHIKPWRDSDNLERLNPKNGILLTPTYDKLFDKGYISFTNDKKLIISPNISNVNAQKLHLVENMEIPLLPILGREVFMEYHRDIIFKTYLEL